MKLDDAYFRGIYNQWLESEGDTAEELIRQVARDAAARCATIVDGWHISKGGYGNLAQAIREEFKIDG